VAEAAPRRSAGRAAGLGTRVMRPAARTVSVNGFPCRVWEAGEGEPLGVLAGLGGTPRWTPFLERLAERHRVIVPSLPGFPGALGHDRLDDLSDWVSATLDLLEGAGLYGVDLVGSSVGGMLAAEVAAFSRATVRRLVLVSPFGLFDEREPVADLFARKPREVPELLCARPEAFAAQREVPPGEDPAEWVITLARADEAAARLLWPLGDRGLAKRLHRIRVPARIVWGERDRVIPPSYAERFARGLGSRADVLRISQAGHLVDVDRPEDLAQAIEEFLRSS
jgi:pimeloyl-ACP methyl ester carboxylesterase